MSGAGMEFMIMLGCLMAMLHEIELFYHTNDVQLTRHSVLYNGVCLFHSLTR